MTRTWGAIAFAGVVAADQSSKVWVRAHVPLGRDTVLIPGLFNLTHAPNRGVAFSALADLPDSTRVPLLLFVPLVATVVLTAVLGRRWRTLPAPGQVAWVMILGGAVGNLIDRVRWGAVTDFVRFRIGERSLFVNNIADDFISIGAAWLVLEMLLASRRSAARQPTTTEG